MQRVRQMQDPATQMEVVTQESALCESKVVDLRLAEKQRASPKRKTISKYAKGRDRESLLAEINRYMLRGTPVQEIAEKYDVAVSTVYTWINEVRELRVSQLSDYSTKSIMADWLADRKERIRLLYQIIDDPQTKPRDKLNALGELRKTADAFLELMKGTKHYQVFLEDFARQKDKAERDADIIHEMLDLFLRGVDAEMNGTNVMEHEDFQPRAEMKHKFHL